MATTNLNLTRRTIKVGAFSTFQLPEFPPLPPSLVVRVPAEKTEYEARVKLFTQHLNTALGSALSANPTNH